MGRAKKGPCRRVRNGKFSHYYATISGKQIFLLKEDNYDALNRPTQVFDPRDGITSATYDANSNMTSLTDAAGNTTSWEFDRRDRAIRETNQKGDARLAFFDDLDRQTQITDRLGQERHFTYDKLDRLTEEAWRSLIDNGLDDEIVPIYKFSYDDAGQLSNVKDGSDATMNAFLYDKRGNVVQENQTVGYWNYQLDYQFDSIDRRIDLKVGFLHPGWPSSTDESFDFQNAYEYDALSRLKSITQSERTDAIGEIQYEVYGKRAEFDYNNLGQWTNITRYAGDAYDSTPDEEDWEVTVTTDYEYDGLGRTVGILHATPKTWIPYIGSGSEINHYTYQYDVLNRMTQMASVDGTSNYTYDAADQLRNADHDVDDISSIAPDDEHYETDLNGNRFEKGTGSTYSAVDTSENNEIENDGTYRYEYDAEGQRTAKISLADEDERFVYKYDARHRMTQVTIYDDAGDIVSTVDYSYDAFNRRTLRVETPYDEFGDPSPVSWLINRYVYDGSDVILDHANTWNQTSLTASSYEIKRYLWAPHMNGGETSLLVAQEVIYGATALENVYWALADHQNSIRDLIRIASGTPDTLVRAAHYVYDAFGNLSYANEFGYTVAYANLTRYLYTSQEYDLPLKHYLYAGYGGTRIYDPFTGTFETIDPIGFLSGDTNLYRYVFNSSMNYTDPSGLDDLPAGQMYNKAGGPPAGTVYNKGKGGGNVSGPRANGEGQNKTCPPQPNNGGYDPAEANREMDRVNANAANADARKAQTIANNPGIDAQDSTSIMLALPGKIVDSVVDGTMVDSGAGYIDELTDQLNPFGGGTRIGPVFGNQDAYNGGRVVGGITGTIENSIMLVHSVLNLPNTLRTLANLPQMVGNLGRNLFSGMRWAQATNGLDSHFRLRKRLKAQLRCNNSSHFVTTA